MSTATIPLSMLGTVGNMEPEDPLRPLSSFSGWSGCARGRRHTLWAGRLSRLEAGGETPPAAGLRPFMAWEFAKCHHLHAMFSQMHLSGPPLCCDVFEIKRAARRCSSPPH